MSRLNFLERERKVLEEVLPGVDSALAAIPLLQMERPGNPAIPVFKRLGGPGLLVPAQFGGRGASPLQALRAQCAIAARAPSLAVATTMHHFTIASLVEIAPDNPGQERELLEQVAKGNLYIASAFAEGRTGSSIQTSALRVEKAEHGLFVSGSKKPCSLSQSMDLLTISLPAPERMDATLAAAIIRPDTPGIERRPFWKSPILAGAESDELVLNRVWVPEDALVPLGGPGLSNDVQERGMLWFELMITACYVGIVGALAEHVFSSVKGGAAQRVSLAADVEGAIAALEAIARDMEAGNRSSSALARMLLVRYAVQSAIDRASTLAVELLGGLAFIAIPDVSYLFAATRGLSFHPPSRLSASERIDAYLAGNPLVLD
jgi:alkylation response protein AidB-like acyl-CoA dehydrogenase